MFHSSPILPMKTKAAYKGPTSLGIHAPEGPGIPQIQPVAWRVRLPEVLESAIAREPRVRHRPPSVVPATGRLPCRMGRFSAFPAGKSFRLHPGPIFCRWHLTPCRSASAHSLWTAPPWRVGLGSISAEAARPHYVSYQARYSPSGYFVMVLRVPFVPQSPYATDPAPVHDRSLGLVSRTIKLTAPPDS